MFFFPFSISSDQINQTHFLKGLCVRFLCPLCTTSMQLINKFLLRATQIKHVGCCLSVYQHCVLLLISVISTDISGDAIVIVSQAEHWNIGLLVMVELFIWTTRLLLGYVVHVNETLRAWQVLGMVRWRQGEMIHALSANFSSSAELQHCQCDWSGLWSGIAFFHHQPHCTIKHFQHTQISADELIRTTAGT